MSDPLSGEVLQDFSKAVFEAAREEDGRETIFVLYKAIAAIVEEARKVAGEGGQIPVQISFLSGPVNEKNAEACLEKYRPVIEAVAAAFWHWAAAGNWFMLAFLGRAMNEIWDGSRRILLLEDQRRSGIITWSAGSRLN